MKRPEPPGWDRAQRWSQCTPQASNLAVELTGQWVLDVFNLERGGEYPQDPERNRPPRMGHVVVVAGNVERLASFREPRDAAGEPVRVAESQLVGQLAHGRA